MGAILKSAVHWLRRYRDVIRGLIFQLMYTEYIIHVRPGQNHTQSKINLDCIVTDAEWHQ